MRQNMCSNPKLCDEWRPNCSGCEYDARYVRADVAKRYARMRERKANTEIHGWNIAVWHNRFGDKSNDFYKAKKEYEEAQQAAQRGKR